MTVAYPTSVIIVRIFAIRDNVAVCCSYKNLVTIRTAVLRGVLYHALVDELRI